jgi:hypothetical protein
MPNVNNVIGARGENILRLAFTRLIDAGEPLFDPVFLGEKHSIIDLYVEIPHQGNLRPFFFVQVKATTLGYLAAPRRLRIRLTRDNESQLLNIPVPTYLVGVDEQNQRAYIRSIHVPSAFAISSLRFWSESG